jgi:uncharacterized membrane protein YfcA
VISVEHIIEPLTLVDDRLLIVALILLGAGTVKGTVGFGLPLVGVSLLSNVVPVQLAVAIIAIPILVTNLWLGIQGGQFLAVLRRYWPVILALGGGLFLGARLLKDAPDKLLLAIIGVIVISYVLFEILGPTAVSTVAAPMQRWLGIVAGLLGGVLGGISTAWGPPVLMYLAAQNLPKSVFVSTVGVIWFFAAVFLILSFSSLSVLDEATATLSVMALAPVSAGMLVGQWLRGHIKQQQFQRIVLLALALVGANLLRRAFFN